MKITSPCSGQINITITLEDDIQYPDIGQIPVHSRYLADTTVVKVIPVNGMPYLIRNRFGGIGVSDVQKFNFWKVFN